MKVKGRIAAYIGATVIFVAVVLFFAPVTVFDLMSMKQEIRELRLEQQRCTQQIRDDSLFIERWHNDDEFLEKFAREKFYLHRKDEQIFIVDKQKQ